MFAPWRRSFALVVGMLTLAGSQSPVFGGWYLNHLLGDPVETIYASSSYEVSSPDLVTTSYLSPTSYRARSYVLSPAAYLYPTSYAAPTYLPTPTAYLLPTYYRPTTYYSPRRLVERPIYASTSYLYPTTYQSSYYYPTVFDYATDSACCEESPPCSTGGTPPAYRPPAPRSSRTSSAPADRVPSEVESTPANPEPATKREDSAPYTLPPHRKSTPPAAAPPTAAPPAAAPPVRNEPERAQPLDPGTESPPNPTNPVVDPEEMNPPLPLPPGKKEPEKKKPAAAGPPVAPTHTESPSETPLQLPPDETLKHQAKKPVTPYTTRSALQVENVLAGKVVSHETGDLEEGVKITLSNRLRTFNDRVEKTDALGRFAVRLADGDWAVKVTMPSGRTYVVSNVTVSNGKITDDLGRDIPSLVITR